MNATFTGKSGTSRVFAIGALVAAYIFATHALAQGVSSVSSSITPTVSAAQTDSVATAVSQGIGDMFGVGLMAFVSSVYAADEHSMEHHQQMQDAQKPALLTEAGNDVFGTIAEAIVHLNADPDTDWAKVDITALKEHLLDMRDMTINVVVVSKKALKNGSEIVIRAKNNRTRQAMKQILSAHPAQLKLETDWQMKVQKQDQEYRLTTTTNNPKDVNKIIGLGYIGLMAYGSHHQTHHWKMATGGKPHSH